MVYFTYDGVDCFGAITKTHSEGKLISTSITIRPLNASHRIGNLLAGEAEYKTFCDPITKPSNKQPMTKSFKLLMVQMPNFIRYERPPRPKQEGFNSSDSSISIEELTPEEAAQYAEEMRLAFLAHYEEKTKYKK